MKPLTLAAMVVALSLSGCAAQIGTAVDRVASEAEDLAEGIEDINDAKAKAYMKLQCAISIGASFRVLTPRQRENANDACNPATADQLPLNAPETVSLETLKALGVTINQ